MELLPPSESRLLEGASRMLNASAFTADATLDGLIFASRAMAAGSVARRGIWLRAWQADVHSKHHLGIPILRRKIVWSPSRLYSS